MLMSKKQYEIELAQYEAWISIIKFLSFGKIDLSDSLIEIFKDVEIIDW